MIQLKLLRSILGVAAMFAAVGGCVPPSGTPFRATATQWVGCSDTERDAVGGGSTLVQICAALDARNYLGSNAPGGGVRVARIVNSGPGVEARWGLLVGHEYFVIIKPGGAGPGGQYQIVGPGPGDRRVGNYHQCDPTHGKPAKSSAKFGECSLNVTSKGEHVNHFGAAGDAGVAGAGPREGPAWISCPSGCCTTGAE